MDLDFWWLLVIPVAFALGWIASRYDLKTLLSENANLPRSYFRGLNFLLNEQHDKAIDAFIEVAKLDPETIELHFALGNLFRRRGETDRAIRVHQNLLSRADLPVAERDHALFELGQDFLKAGLLDRAEETFRSLEAGEYALGAQRALLTIYEIEKDWPKSIATAERIEKMGAPSLNKEIAHFHCELAQEALQRKNPDEARAELKLALAANPENVRATILVGDVDAAAGTLEAAIVCWKRVETQNAAYLPLVAEKLMNALSALGRASEGVDLLIDYASRYPSNDLLDVAFKHAAELRGLEAAHALARQQMQAAPNLAGMTRLLEAQEATADEPRRGELQLMRALVKQRTKNLPRYTCQTCGFRARLFYWQCPGCSGWETYAPRRVEPITG
ncbi:Heat shock (predicted periplasmic) protein YciM, precursor [Caballeronia glathei]|uniref:Lipopolysaccharide assembly protein B n=1 Tax=Caballeronia glathei TaxID=60547 RepID=A0A069PI62_9BURK|nr:MULTISPECIES: lipopolysaccharide assembly protein LapB [Burkholderiaceae]KDR40418.1 N-acetylglucosaminyl transferase [Caballeronia glathei]TCK42876.1 lipopolysaccharide biosynthesis regulator YciM [Paraburkholderia sp. BL8N3]CDY75980.1 Heat shock (predicted periplasmic) protein YciM, precursor [Caballeronia glathei]